MIIMILHILQIQKWDFSSGTFMTFSFFNTSFANNKSNEGQGGTLELIEKNGRKATSVTPHGTIAVCLSVGVSV